MTSQQVRELSLDDKIQYFKGILEDLENTNETDILNVFRLANTYNTFDNDFFDNEESYIVDISEFIDIKMALEEEVRTFSTVLVTWYLSALASCDVKADDDIDSAVPMPPLVYGFFVCATIPVMASLMNSIDLTTIDMGGLYKVKGAFLLMSKMFQTQSFVATCLTKF